MSAEQLSLWPGFTNRETRKQAKDRLSRLHGSLGLANNTKKSPDWQAKRDLALDSYLVADADLSIHTGTVHLQTYSSSRKQLRKCLARRERIQAFSAPARRRLMLLIARIDPRQLCQPLWITLTVHESHQFDLRHVINAFDVWLHRVKRRYPDVQYLWRLALQNRGAPHIHLLLWRPAGCVDHLSGSARRWFGSSWHQVADPDSVPHGIFGAKVEVVQSWRRVRTYVAKYIAAEQEPFPHVYTGKRWGRSVGLPLTCLLTCTPSRVILTYVRRIVRSWLCAHVKRRRWAAHYLSGAHSADVMIPAVIPLRALQAAIRSGLDPPDDLDLDGLPRVIAEAQSLLTLETIYDKASEQSHT